MLELQLMDIFVKIQKFLGEVRIELGRVKFPDRPQTIRLTLIVLVVCVILGVYIGAIDFGLTKVIEIFVR